MLWKMKKNAWHVAKRNAEITAFRNAVVIVTVTVIVTVISAMRMGAVFLDF